MKIFVGLEGIAIAKYEACVGTIKAGKMVMVSWRSLLNLMMALR
jgi:hypothetical protein